MEELSLVLAEVPTEEVEAVGDIGDLGLFW